MAEKDSGFQGPAGERQFPVEWAVDRCLSSCCTSDVYHFSHNGGVVLGSFKESFHAAFDNCDLLLKRNAGQDS